MIIKTNIILTTLISDSIVLLHAACICRIVIKLMRIHSWNTALFSTNLHFNLFSIKNHCLYTFPERWLCDFYCIQPQKHIPVLSITYLQIRLKSQGLSRYFKGLMTLFFYLGNSRQGLPIWRLKLLYYCHCMKYSQKLVFFH